MRAITNPSLLILHHHHDGGATTLLRSFRRNFSLFPPSFSISNPKSRAYSTASTSSAEPQPGSLITESNERTGRSGSLALPPTHLDIAHKIDVNPPKGTRDFPPEDMRLRSWLFQNFREVSQLFGFEEVIL
ncbi:unnamed protein product [Fraxinus pennsylvanica]|uniref:histidine--tRNA ligase n=1 Tax=Fraxinus pennsylvanica TaxID=56036 RepID=A0AAD1Z9H4_9LAMI|nr:unnamed protein product [Fraxinus pennsylvanica]